MAISTSGATTNTFSASRSPSFTLSASPATDDIIVAFVSSTTTATITIPSTWENVLGGTTDVESDSHQSCMVYHRVTSGEAGTTTWTLTNLYDATETGRVSAVLLTGIKTSSELVGSSSTFSSANAATPWVIASVTPSANDCIVIAGVSGDGTQTQSTPSGWSLAAGAGTTQSNYLYTRNTLGQDGVPTGTTNVTPSAGDEYISIVACFADAITTVNAIGDGAWGGLTGTADATVFHPPSDVFATAEGVWGGLDATAASIVEHLAVAEGVWGGLTATAAATVTPGGSTWYVPTGLTATAVSASQIDLAWDSVPDAIGYDIERNGTVVVYDLALTSYSDTGLASETLYEYRVRAVG